MQPVGKNIKTRVEGNTLIIEVDLSKDQGFSKSGKNTLIATSKGLVGVPGAENVRIGLNVIK